LICRFKTAEDRARSADRCGCVVRGSACWRRVIAVAIWFFSVGGRSIRSLLYSI